VVLSGQGVSLRLIGGHTVVYELPGDGHALKGARDAIVLLHGFPADTTKNEDIAESIRAELGADVYIPHQPGLGDCPGTFSFEGALLAMEELLADIVTRHDYRSIVLLGHSWGGFIALHLATKAVHPNIRLVLLSPLFVFPASDDIRGILEDFANARGLLKNDAQYVEKLLAETERLRGVRLQPPSHLAGRIYVYHGEQDEVIPAASTRLLAAHLPPDSLVEFVNDDHWYTETRAILRGRIVAWLQAQGVGRDTT